MNSTSPCQSGAAAAAGMMMRSSNGSAVMALQQHNASPPMSRCPALLPSSSDSSTVGIPGMHVCMYVCMYAPCSERKLDLHVHLILSLSLSLLTSPFGFCAGNDDDLDSELWHACAGPLVSLPSVNSLVVYWPQGHLEQVKILVT